MRVKVAGNVVFTGVNDLTNRNNDSDNSGVSDYQSRYVKPLAMWVRGLNQRETVNYF